MFSNIPLPAISFAAFDAPVCPTDLRPTSNLYQAELARMGAQDKRRAEFLGGRHAAHTALTKAGAGHKAHTMIGRDSFGAPQWPNGWTGSISHSNGTYVAVAAPQEQYLSIGIDIETVRAGNLDRAISRLCRSDNDAGNIAPIALFSAKEAIYKAVHPQLGGHLWFTDFTITHLDPCGRFEWVLNPNTNIHGAGYCHLMDTMVLSCVTLPGDYALNMAFPAHHSDVFCDAVA